MLLFFFMLRNYKYVQSVMPYDRIKKFLKNLFNENKLKQFLNLNPMWNKFFGDR